MELEVVVCFQMTKLVLLVEAPVDMSVIDVMVEAGVVIVKVPGTNIDKT